MEIKDLREQIDKIDDELSALYVKRMKICKQIGELKAKDSSPVNVKEREDQILIKVTKKADDELKGYVKHLYDNIFTQSKNYQSSLRRISSPTSDEIRKVLEDRKKFPICGAVACQGVEGAYSGIATKRLFEVADITYFKTFEGVFNAVEKGLCEYGVLPIENSTAGSVLSVYDLMKKHKFYIVKSIRVKINHCLAVKNPNAKITKIYSHAQALSQCAEYIKETGVETVEVENTAVAGQLVANSEEENIGAICSEECARLYNLKIVENNIQDLNSNYTRFICISKELKIFKGADKISVMTALEHRVGSLNNLLSRFYTQGLNLTKLESRPIGSGDFEFMFYFDFVGDVESDGVLNLLAELESNSDKFVFLGSYKEEV